MIFKVPPQFEQCSRSILKTRLSSLAQLMRAKGEWGDSVSDRAGFTLFEPTPPFDPHPCATPKRPETCCLGPTNSSGILDTRSRSHVFDTLLRPLANRPELAIRWRDAAQVMYIVTPPSRKLTKVGAPMPSANSRGRNELRDSHTHQRRYDHVTATGLKSR